MRAFIAIDLPQEIKNHLGQLKEKLRAGKTNIKWVKPADIHITLKFLGEINEQIKESVSAAIKDTAEETAIFSIQICSAGAFPDMKYPRVIWVGAGKGSRETTQIAGRLEEKLEKIGVVRENRKFNCHLTIGRVKSNSNKLKLREMIAEIEKELKTQSLEFTAGKITLFKSTLTSKGPVYEQLYAASLKTT